VIVYHSIFTGYARAIPESDGFAAAVFAVLQRSWIGVPLFFVISGYCVIASADAARRRRHPGATFFWRRFRRIYPPYWVWFGLVVTAVFVVEGAFAPGFFAPAHVPGPQSLTFGQWFGNVTLTETWRWHVTGGVERWILSPAWTLCYEEQFYAVVGLVLLAAPRYFFGTFVWVSIFVGVGLFAFPSLGIRTEGLFLDGQWLMFAAGLLAYYALNYASARGRFWSCVALGFGVLCAVAEPRLLLRPRVGEPNLSFLAAFVFALFIIMAKRWDGFLTSARCLRPLRFCGVMCYSLYLVHWPVVTVVGHLFDVLGVKHPAAVLGVTVPACVAVAVSVAWLFHVLVERRFMNAPYRPAPTTRQEAL
jgi:peptidoglycan/LPS O-acetylase OafA/YrhL